MTPPGAPPAKGLLGVAPQRHAARDIQIRMQRLPDGGLKFTPTAVPTFSMTAHTVLQLDAALRKCTTEVEIQANAVWKGECSELATFNVDEDGLPPKVTRLPATGKGHRARDWHSDGGSAKEQHPSVWKPNPDGSFTSEVSGKTFRDPKLTARIRRRRILAGLPIVPVDGKVDLSAGGLAETVNDAAAKAGVGVQEFISRAVAAFLETPAPVPPSEPVSAPAPGGVVDFAAARRRRRKVAPDPNQPVIEGIDELLAEVGAEGVAA